MRALRKIIFVNSAHIRYAEVRLDGNVHFIGTQGVGKSTLLRAILFFYNADKLHLGIPKEMKSYDEFYLPHANSYIVYEVEHEHGPFCVLTFRSSGRACYRFIDAAYRKEWLIDEKGEVTADSKVIRERLGGASMSKIIDRYEQYRDILYGNKQAVDKEFARFQLMESNRYQNIPRSIQNVFLNSRLDANFIKDIIIRSMSEEEANIDLGYYRRQVADFEQEYKDISCWYKQNQKGESIVRTQAENVVKTYRELLFMKRQIAELCGELKYAIRTSRERLPLVEKKIDELIEEQNRLKRLISELQQKFDTEKSSLNQEQGAVNDRLKHLKERKEYYAAEKIEEILKRYEQEQILRVKLDGDNAKLAELTARFNDVTAKYKALCQEIKNVLEKYRQTQTARIISLGQEKQSADERMLTEHTEQRENIEAAFADKITLATNRIEQIKGEKTELEKEMLTLKYWQPYKEETDALSKEINELAIREQELSGLISTTDAKINQLQTEYEKNEAEIMADSKAKLDAKQHEMDEVTAKLAETNSLLERTKGSLYEWLEDNKRDWEQNIGKVINEESVLYQTGLHPQKDEGTSLFGVRLDLADLPLAVRKPAQLKAERAELNAALSSLKAEYIGLTEQQEKLKDELKRRFAPKIRELREQKSYHETELRVIPQKRKSILLKIEEYAAKAEHEKEERTKQLNTRLQDVALRRTAADTELAKTQNEKQKQLTAEDKRYQKAKDETIRLYEQRVAEIRADIRRQEQKADKELQLLQQQEHEELHGRGADTRMVEECKVSITATEAELKYIDDHRRIVFDYQRDREELFDHEEEFKTKKKLITDKLQQLNEKYNLRKQKHNETLNLRSKELDERREEKNRIDNDLQKAERFTHDENLCPPMLAEAQERQTLRTPGQAVDELTGIIVSRQKSQDKLKSTVNVFKGNFTAKNTFNFRTELALDEDYLDFANNLEDFLTYNKIEEFRRRTSERYVDILGRVSKEMGDLTRHESDVDKVIYDINNDFRKRNFAGVIKLIALQPVPSADKMVQLMKRIKNFHDDNQYAMGELNLFSSANRDEVNQKAVGHLLDLMKSLVDNPQRRYLTLSDLFLLQFRIVENDNDTGWVDKLSHVGSEGTDTLVKAMINIMLINVFKGKVSRKFGDFRIHCMMDEIGKLHPQNVKGILDFANARNILLINSSPTTYNVSDYRYTYLLSKDSKSQTVVHPLISQQ
ncbi:ATP-binding protein [Prevotella sp.]|uniref:ATP-binding protein n=2 Tax=Prevotella TaxID=838 RepID=UPI0025EB1676|nr:ATP-binding protein [Prevotella sp.]